MAKGQKRSHREPKKPKQDKPKVAQTAPSQASDVFGQRITKPKRK
jgi:hypothetical protein